MADYYSLLARKISALPQATPQSRQAVYDLARRALLNQLRAIQPPVAEQVIANEGRALDEAIARVEIDCVAGRLSKPNDAGAKNPPKPPPPPAADPRSVAAKSVASSKPVESLKAAEAKDEPIRERSRPAAPLPPTPRRPSGSRRLLLVLAALIVTVGLVALAALRLRERPEDLARLNPDEATPAAAEQGKLSARIGADGKDFADAAQSAAPVARRAALLVGPKNHPEKPERVYDGSVVWRLENASGAEGAPVRPAIRADIDFPEAKLKATLLIQKNEDPTLSASHTVTVNFVLTPGSDFKAIKAMGPLQARRPDTQAGERLIGSFPVPTTENSFLMGLMRGDSEKRNLALLRAPSLIDIPLQFSDDRIGTINLEKGASGDRVFQDALTAWNR